MARVKLDMPDNYSFTTSLGVRISDINYLGHLGSEAVLSFIQEARIRFLNYHHFTEQDIEGCGIVTTDSVINYRADSFHGDTIQIDICVRDVTKYGCDIYYLISNKKTAQEVAHAKTGIAFYDYREQKVVQVPSAFTSVIEREAA